MFQWLELCINMAATPGAILTSSCPHSLHARPPTIKNTTTCRSIAAYVSIYFELVGFLENNRESMQQLIGVDQTKSFCPILLVISALVKLCHMENVFLFVFFERLSFSFEQKHKHYC